MLFGERKKTLDMVETLEKLIELQRTDSGLDELEKIKKGFSQDSATLDANVAQLQKSLQDAKKAFEELVKQRKGLEIEAGSLDQKIKKYLGQQDEVKSNEQFTALTQEIEKSRAEKGRAEEKALELLFKEDEQKARNQELAGQLAQAEKKSVEGKREIQQKIADCDKAAQEKKEERKKQLSGLPGDFAEGYEKLRNSGKKIAVAQMLEDGTCSGCHMNVPPQLLNEMKKNRAIQRCDCGRYLYIKNS